MKYYLGLSQQEIDQMSDYEWAYTNEVLKGIRKAESGK